ncbi:hypothetical protein [Leptolyngbya ohadii]|uniref:hypothetical protein n=1 Tax=Leptolyngbya ohadii TaxID=1962290 RepID=UPI000B59D71B|nr:hypothetical protein [Leptolyngbya ohadii]
MGGEEKRDIRGRLPRSKKIALDVACAKREMSQQQGIEEAIDFWLEIQDQIETLIERCESMGIDPKTALQQAAILWLEKHQ